MASRQTAVQGNRGPESAINVEEFYDVYVRPQILNIEDDGIEAISKNTFTREQSEKVLAKSTKTTGPPRASTSGSNFTPPPPPARRVPHGVNHPSHIGDAVQQIRVLIPSCLATFRMPKCINF